MNKPTPGKWRISPYYPGDIIADNPQSRYPLVVAVCPLADDANFIMAMGEACYLVNPSNPLAVAEALPELVEACRELIAAIDAGIQSRTLLECEGKPGSVMSRIRAALAKIEVKP
jgi:hypothetical protein